MKILPRYKAGYTLIEILVGLTILGLLFGFGYVSFRDFSRRQQLAGILKSINGDLRLAQSQAISGQKPDACGTNVLDGYRFNTVSASEYTIDALCAGNVVNIKDNVFPSGITVNAPTPNPLIFKVLGQGTNVPDGSLWNLVLTSDLTKTPVGITVTAGGEIQ